LATNGCKELDGWIIVIIGCMKKININKVDGYLLISNLCHCLIVFYLQEMDGLDVIINVKRWIITGWV